MARRSVALEERARGALNYEHPAVRFLGDIPAAIEARHVDEHEIKESIDVKKHVAATNLAEADVRFRSGVQQQLSAKIQHLFRLRGIVATPSSVGFAHGLHLR